MRHQYAPRKAFLAFLGAHPALGCIDCRADHFRGYRLIKHHAGDRRDGAIKPCAEELFGIRSEVCEIAAESEIAGGAIDDNHPLAQEPGSTLALDGQILAAGFPVRRRRIEMWSALLFEFCSSDGRAPKITPGRGIEQCREDAVLK